MRDAARASRKQAAGRGQRTEDRRERREDIEL